MLSYRFVAATVFGIRAWADAWLAPYNAFVCSTSGVLIALLILDPTSIEELNLLETSPPGPLVFLAFDVSIGW